MYIEKVEKGLQLGDFKLKKLLGSGGMGEVWLAEQTLMDRFVAVKILSSQFNSNKRFIEKFKNEIKLSAKLNHPNIISAYAAGYEKGIYYFAMPYIDGVELQERLYLEKIDEITSLRMVKNIAEGLQYSWNKFQIVHRDIKPSNIMLNEDGIAMLMDMGISKVATLSSTQKDEYIEGTPHYMSPEQARGESNLDFHSDIYSLGASLYQMLTGRIPFNATKVKDIMILHQIATLPLPRELSKEISYLLEIMMAKNVDDRHNSWEKLISDIDRVLLGSKPISYRHIKSLRTSQEIIQNPKTGEFIEFTKKESFLEKVASFLFL